MEGHGVYAPVPKVRIATNTALGMDFMRRILCCKRCPGRGLHQTHGTAGAWEEGEAEGQDIWGRERFEFYPDEKDGR